MKILESQNAAKQIEKLTEHQFKRYELWKAHMPIPTEIFKVLGTWPSFESEREGFEFYSCVFTASEPHNKFSAMVSVEYYINKTEHIIYVLYVGSSRGIKN